MCSLTNQTDLLSETRILIKFKTLVAKEAWRWWGTSDRRRSLTRAFILFEKRAEEDTYVYMSVWSDRSMIFITKINLKVCPPRYHSTGSLQLIQLWLLLIHSHTEHEKGETINYLLTTASVLLEKEHCWAGYLTWPLDYWYRLLQFYFNSFNSLLRKGGRRFFCV